MCVVWRAVDGANVNFCAILGSFSGSEPIRRTEALYVILCAGLLIRLAHMCWKNKWSHFDLKIWVIGRTEIPGRKKKWSHFDLKIWVTGRTEIPGQILVPPVLTRYRESIEIDSQYLVNLTEIFSNYSESRVEF